MDYKVDHSAFHEFCKEFDINNVQDDETLDTYLAEHPEVVLVGCDDDHHCSSTILLFPHIHMGASVVFVPQCTTTRGRFFLYPRHIDCLIEALQKVRKTIGANMSDDLEAMIENAQNE